MAELVDVVVGVVGRAHGIRGDLAIDVKTDEPDRRFRVSTRLRLESGRSLSVTAVRWHRGRLLVTFDGVSDRTAAEQLTGQRLFLSVLADERPSDPDEYFDRQLVGLAVRDHTGARVGTVSAVEHPPAQDLLIVSVDGEPRMIPFVSSLVPTVDLDEGYLQLADVGGLLEDIE
ncbi:ribosome maturation factor RimM [Tessaracoccus caeni]|uniref:ribosome maturation factor RimM n=1 Tax=Tessaracoccus caeni TaxID=3031239 RepID=UPI0023DA084E|nr:ribosome maturation factor RimM [Tessaracoccus caeni]MDF1489802.1 ribosome maturation factor RimM [Tessaracoccus caeni]